MKLTNDTYLIYEWVKSGHNWEKVLYNWVKTLDNWVKSVHNWETISTENALNRKRRIISHFRYFDHKKDVNTHIHILLDASGYY